MPEQEELIFLDEPLLRRNILERGGLKAEAVDRSKD